jgi:hypothetical protein
MEILSEAVKWAVAVLEHWHGWVSGSILAFAFEISDRIWD